MHRRLIIIYFLAQISLFSTPATAAAKDEGGGWVRIDWSGVDENDGDGNESFGSLGSSLTANLSIRCNKKDGYNIVFYTSQATGQTVSWLKNGSHQLRYTATMDTSGIQNATIQTSTLRLNSPSTASLRVHFNGSGNKTPNSTSKANWLTLNLSLDTVSQRIPAMGTYTDIITATASLN